ncbi:MAG: PhzF family phenazine biosynthesis protein [Actinomycetia bacterium]|nr:PhzF family phenazine biosynthesis protein [Actinomycetes bacterium]MCP4958804.1 PhzF family phenazine biosynthesis protein [Actinomycetes bacterium]
MKIQLWTAFSSLPEGGSPAGVVLDATGLDSTTMQGIASDLGAPATGFVTAGSDDEVVVRFFSTRTEYGMCGHGTIAVLTALFEAEAVTTGPVRLRTGFSTGTANIGPRRDGRVDVLLDLDTAPIEPCVGNLDDIWTSLGASANNSALSRSDFVHLLCPMPLDTIRKLQPDFGALDIACRGEGIDTVAVYSTETTSPDTQLHVRDFCPAVGTPEAAATGTTNRAIISTLAANDPNRFAPGDHTINIEQGIEMGRPSRVQVRFTADDNTLTSIAVGGVATKLHIVEI